MPTVTDIYYSIATAMDNPPDARTDKLAVLLQLKGHHSEDPQFLPTLAQVFQLIVNPTFSEETLTSREIGFPKKLSTEQRALLASTFTQSLDGLAASDGIRPKNLCAFHEKLHAMAEKHLESVIPFQNSAVLEAVIGINILGHFAQSRNKDYCPEVLPYTQVVIAKRNDGPLSKLQLITFEAVTG